MLAVIFFIEVEKGGEIMTPQNASRLGRKLWRNRAMYERRRKFGEEENRIEELRKSRYNYFLVDNFRTRRENKQLARKNRRC